jgi:hypothetical protein
LTALVVVIIAISKFNQGIWIILIIVPILILLMLFVKREYRQEEEVLAIGPQIIFTPPHRRQKIVIVAQMISRAVVQAIKVAQTMDSDISLVHVTLDQAEGEQFRERIERQFPGISVVLVESPYRALVRPLIRYLEVLREEDPERVIIVLLPEFLPRHWWDRILYNQNTYRIRAALVGHKEFVVLDVPYRH